MKLNLSIYRSFLTVILLAITSSSLAQSYRKDSLQIKVYTTIDYKNNQAKDIKLLEVLCDYCTEIQKKAIGEQALKLTFNDRFNPENRLSNGQKKLAIYIRVAKKDLAAIKEDIIEN